MSPNNVQHYVVVGPGNIVIIHGTIIHAKLHVFKPHSLKLASILIRDLNHSIVTLFLVVEEVDFGAGSQYTRRIISKRRTKP